MGVFEKEICKPCIDGYDHYNVTVVGPDARFDIHREVVIAKSEGDATRAAISAVKERFGYARARVETSVFPIVPHPAYPPTIHADDYIEQEAKG